MVKKRTYNYNLIKSRRTYTFEELSAVLRIHIRTIQSWRKEGLNVLDEATRPFWILGEEIIRFLKDKRQKRKRPLNPGQFYCTTCRKPQYSLPDKFSIITTNKRLGKTAYQILIKGICEVCGRRLTVFSSDKKILKDNLLPKGHQTTLFDNSNSSLNTDILKGDKNENQSPK